MALAVRALVVMALVLGACGTDSSSSTPSRNMANQPPQETVVPADCKGMSMDMVTTVQITNRSFRPEKITVVSGSIIRWVNDDDVTHTVTSGVPTQAVTGQLFDQQLQPGDSFCYQAHDTHTDRNDEIHYFCRIHNEMRGELVVEPMRVHTGEPR